MRTGWLNHSDLIACGYCFHSSVLSVKQYLYNEEQWHEYRSMNNFNSFTLVYFQLTFTLVCFELDFICWLGRYLYIEEQWREYHSNSNFNRICFKLSSDEKQDSFCWRASVLSSNCTSDRVLWIQDSLDSLSHAGEIWSFEFSLEILFLEEFVLRGLKSLSFELKLFFTPGGWHKVKCVYWMVLVGLKWMCTSRSDLFLNLSPLEKSFLFQTIWLWDGDCLLVHDLFLFFVNAHVCTMGL